jgi:hypothetical protein
MASALAAGSAMMTMILAWGEPLCPRCYQADAQVLWNALSGRLWSRTTVYLYRALAHLAGLTEGELRRLVRISFAKVAEYQKRGAVHFHAIIRLDAATDCGCPACVMPPDDQVHRRHPRARRPAGRDGCGRALPTGRGGPGDDPHGPVG